MILEGGISYNQNWDKNGNIYYTDENGQVVDFKVNPFVKLANKAKATATNIGNWINETNPNSEAYKQKVSAIVGLETLPLGLGRFATQGIAKGLTPYVGRKIAQNMATGASSGVASGTVTGGLEAGLNDRNIGLGALKGGFWGLLGGLGSGYGLGKVAQKLNTQTAWHGSPYKFDRFSNEAIGTGEGAQAHGYGHYAAKQKNIAENYADVLSNDKPIEIKYKGEKYKVNFNNDIMDWDIQGNVENLTPTERSLFEKIDSSRNLKHIKEQELKQIDRMKRMQGRKNRFRDAQKSKDIINILDSGDLEMLPPDKHLYKLSIPKDDVMLREDLPFSEQPLKVQEGLKAISDKYLPKYFFNNMQDQIDYNKSGKSIYNAILGDIQSLNPDVINHNNRGQFAGKLLDDYGIKGISYNGGIDGEANVIFNPDDIDIIPYYDNPTSLKEKFINLLNR